MSLEELKQKYINKCIDDGEFLEALIASGDVEEVKDIKLTVEKNIPTFSYAVAVSMKTGHREAIGMSAIVTESEDVQKGIRDILSTLLSKYTVVLKKKEK